MKKFLLLILLFGLFAKSAQSQTVFHAVDSFSHNLSLTGHSVMWFDFDNDGDYDILRTDFSNILLYENLGSDTFQWVNNIPLFDYVTSSMPRLIDLKDIDNDGDIDLIIKNYNSVPYILAENKMTTNGTFTIHYKPNYQDLSFSSLCNITNFQGKDLLIRKNNINIIAQINNSFGINYIDTIYGDYFNRILYLFPTGKKHNYDINNDGFFDFIAGDYLIINNGFDSVNKFSYISRVNSLYNEAHYADLNNDGFLDEISNAAYNNFNNLVSANNHNNSLVKRHNTGLDTSSNFITTHLFDYNNDGLIDILNLKANSSNFLYQNNGNFSFTVDSSIQNLGSNCYGASAADYDNDGDLDLAIISKTSGKQLIIYRNDSTPPNNSPTKPTKLWTTIGSKKIVFHWDKASDVETPQQSLSYNIMIGTSPNGIDIVSPMADTATGFRRVVDIGNAQLNNFFILDKSRFNIGDTLYWRVQTIDNSMGYSKFSKLNTTVICNRMEAPMFDTICANDSVFWRGNYFSTQGVHNDSYYSNECDSTFSLILEVKPAYLTQQNVDICSNQAFFWNGQNYYNPGIYIRKYSNIYGCDSIEKLVLKVNHSITTMLSEILCRGDSLIFGNKAIYSAGFYIDSMNTINNCDSIVELTLEVFPKDTMVYKQNDSLVVQGSSSFVRWWNCSDQSYVPHQNTRVFVPNQAGLYAAELTENGCSWLSKCFDFNYLNIEKLTDFNGISIAPNPASDIISIKSDQLSNNSIIEIYSSDLKLIKRHCSTNNREEIIEIDKFLKGLYFVKIINEKQFYVSKFVKH